MSAIIVGQCIGTLTYYKHGLLRSIDIKNENIYFLKVIIIGLLSTCQDRNSYIIVEDFSILYPNKGTTMDVTDTIDVTETRS